MTLDEFWNGPPHLVRYFREAHRLKIEEENQKAWVQGLYVKSALDSALSALFKRKGSKGIPYLERPLEILKKSEREKEIEAARQRLRVASELEKMRLAQIGKKRREKRECSEKAEEKSCPPQEKPGPART